MVRALWIVRQPFGQSATLTRTLAPQMETFGVEAVVDDATGWIPDPTGRKVDPEVSGRLRDAVKGFDLVHAWGYRSAWACAEAYGSKRPWVWTAPDHPKTTHRDLVERLCRSRLGFCVAEAVRAELDAAGVRALEVWRPGVPAALAPRGSELPEATWPLVVGAGRFVPERGFEAVLAGWRDVRRVVPLARLWLVGEGPEGSALAGRAGDSDSVRVLRRSGAVLEALSRATLVVVPSARAGFSLVAAEAMRLGKPVLLRAAGGLREMGTDRVNLFWFESDAALGERIGDLLQQTVTLEAVARAGRVRAAEAFSLERAASELATAYRRVLRS